MLKNLKYVLDVGSSALRLIAVTRFNNKINVVTKEEVLYDGYMDGEFLMPEKLEEALTELTRNMVNKIRKLISTIVVGVPAEFSKCVCKRISRKFVEMHKITEADIQDLYESNADFGDSQNYELINYSAMQFVLDGNDKTLSPINKKTDTLILDASYILAKKSFTTLIGEKLTKIGVDNVEFISTPLGQAMNCPDESNKPYAVVDVGHISTSVCVYKGEGLALLSSFSMGGGHISSDIMQVLGLNFKDAELIKRKVILTIDSNKNDYYETCYKGNLIKAPINITNQIVKSRIEMIAKIIGEILSIDDVFKGINVYLTGDGISNFKGARNIIKENSNLNVFEYRNQFDNSKDKYQTSVYGLATLAEVAK